MAPSVKWYKRGEPRNPHGRYDIPVPDTEVKVRVLRDVIWKKSLEAGYVWDLESIELRNEENGLVYFDDVEDIPSGTYVTYESVQALLGSQVETYENALQRLKAIRSLFDSSGRPTGVQTSIEGCKAGRDLVGAVLRICHILSEVDAAHRMETFARDHAKVAQSISEHCNNVGLFFGRTEKARDWTEKKLWSGLMQLGSGNYAKEARQLETLLEHDIKALSLPPPPIPWPYIKRQASAATERGNVLENKFKSLRGDSAVVIVLKLQLHAEWMFIKVSGGVLTKLARDEQKRLMSDPVALELVRSLQDKALAEVDQQILAKYVILKAAWPTAADYALAVQSARAAVAAGTATITGTAAERSLLEKYRECKETLAQLLRLLQPSAATVQSNALENKFKSFGRQNFAVDIVLKLESHVQWMCEKVSGGELITLACDEQNRLVSDKDALDLYLSLEHCLDLERTDQNHYNRKIFEQYAILKAYWPTAADTAVAVQSAHAAVAAGTATITGTAAERALLEKYRECKEALAQLLRLLRPIDIGLITKGLSGVNDKLAGIRGKNLILLLGATGAGKSTTIWFLKNKAMRRSANEMSIVPAVGDAEMASFKIGERLVSETSGINMIAAPNAHLPNLVLVDTPGFGDTRGVGMDIVNSFSISSAAQVAASIRILALFSKAELRDKGQGLQESLSQPLAAMMNNAYDHMDSVMIKLTKINLDDPLLRGNELSSFVSGIDRDPSATIEVQDTQKAVIRRINHLIWALEGASKPISDIVLLPLPGGSNADKLLNEILQMPSLIPSEAFKKSYVNGKAEVALREQMNFDLHSIIRTSRQLLQTRLVDNTGILKAREGQDFFYYMQIIDFRLRQLRDLSASLSSVSFVTDALNSSSEEVQRVIDTLKMELQECIVMCTNQIDIEGKVAPGCDSALKLILYDIFMFSDEKLCSYFTPQYGNGERLVGCCNAFAVKLCKLLRTRVDVDFLDETCAMPELTRDQLEEFEAHMANEAGPSLQKLSLLCRTFSHVYKAVAFGMLEMLHAPEGEYVVIAAGNALSGPLIDAARIRGLKTISLVRNVDEARPSADHSIRYDHDDGDFVGKVKAIIAGSAVAGGGAPSGNLAFGACDATVDSSMKVHMKYLVQPGGSVVSYDRMLPFEIFTEAFGEDPIVENAVLPRIMATFHLLCAAVVERLADTDILSCLPKLELLRVFDEMIAKYLRDVVACATAREAYRVYREQFITMIQALVDEGVEVVSGDVMRAMENHREPGYLPSPESLGQLERFVIDSNFFAKALASMALVDKLQARHPKCIEEETIHHLVVYIKEAVEHFLDTTLGFICKMHTSSGAFRVTITYMVVIETFTADPYMSKFCVDYNEALSLINANVVRSHATASAEVDKLGVENADVEWGSLRKSLAFLKEVSGALNNAPAEFKSAAKIYTDQFAEVTKSMCAFLESEALRLQKIKHTIGYEDPVLLRAYLQKFDNMNKLLALGVSCLDDAVAFKLGELVGELLQTFEASLAEATTFARSFFEGNVDSRVRLEHAPLRKLRGVFVTLNLLERSAEKLPPLAANNISKACADIAAQISRFFDDATRVFLGSLENPGSLKNLAPSTVVAAFRAIQSDADLKENEDKISDNATSIKLLIECMRLLNSFYTVVGGSGLDISSDLAYDFFGSKPSQLANQFGFELLEKRVSIKINSLPPPALLSYDAELAQLAKGELTLTEMKGAWCLAASLATCELYLPEAYRGFSTSAEVLTKKIAAVTTDRTDRVKSNIKSDKFLEVVADLPSLKARPLQPHDQQLLLLTKKLLKESIGGKLALKLKEVSDLNIDSQWSHVAFFDGVKLIASALTIFAELFADGLGVEDAAVVLDIDPLMQKLKTKVQDHQEHIKSLMERWELKEAEKSLTGLQKFKNAASDVLVVSGHEETRNMYIEPLQLFTEDCIGLVNSVELFGGSQEMFEGSQKAGGGRSAPLPPVPSIPVGQPRVDANAIFANFDSVLAALKKKDMKKFLQALELDALTADATYEKMSDTIRRSISTKVSDMLALINADPSDYDLCDKLLTKCNTLVSSVPASYKLLAANLEETRKKVEKHKIHITVQIENERQNLDFAALHKSCINYLTLKNNYRQYQPNEKYLKDCMTAIGDIFAGHFVHYRGNVDKEEMSVVFSKFGNEPLQNLVVYAEFSRTLADHIAKAEAEASQWLTTLPWTARKYVHPQCFSTVSKKSAFQNLSKKTFDAFYVFRDYALSKADEIAGRVLAINVNMKTIADSFDKLLGLKAFIDTLVKVDRSLKKTAFDKTRQALVKTALTLHEIYSKTVEAQKTLLSSLAREDQGLAVARKALDDILHGLGELKVASDAALFSKIKEYTRSGLDPTHEILAICSFDSNLYDIAQTAFINVIIEWTAKLNATLFNNEELIGVNTESADRDRFYSDMSKKYELVKLCVEQLKKSNMLGVSRMNDLNRSFTDFIANMRQKLDRCCQDVKEKIGYLPTATTFDPVEAMNGTISSYSRRRDNLRACFEKFEDKDVKAAAKLNLDLADDTFRTYLESVATDGERRVGDNVDLFKHNIEPFIDCLINLHNLSIHALSWKATVNARIDEVLSLRSDPQNIQEKLSSLNQCMLSRNESKKRGSEGSLLAILHGHGAFTGVSIYLRNKRATKSLEDVLGKMLNPPEPNRDGASPAASAQIPAISSDLHDFLLSEGRKFEEEYWNMVESGFGSPIRACSDILASVKPFKMDAIQGSIDRGEFPALIRNLMVKIFAWWTLNKMGSYVIHQASDEDQMAGGGGEGQPPSWRQGVMHPLPSQMLAVMLFFHDAKVSAIDGVLELSRQFLQIPTGEGKSVLLGVSSTILALLGFNADCACYSAYLSSRDDKSFRSMFEAFGVSPYVTYGTFEKLCEDLINAPLKAKNADGIRGEVNSFISGGDGQDVGAAARASRIDLDGRQERPNAVIIDEVDMFFSEHFYGNSYRPLLHLRDPTITALAEYLWLHPETSPSAALASDEFKSVLARFPTWHDFLKNKLKEMISDLRGMKDYKRDDPNGYIVENRRIGKILANHDGALFNIVDGFSTMWAHFREFKSKSVERDVLDEAISIPIFCGSFSFAEIPKKYRNMVGCTGTLETMSPTQKSIFESDYGIKTWNYLPTMYSDNQREFAGNEVSDCKIESKGDYFKAITAEIRTRLSAKVTIDGHTASVEGRAVLVFFEDISQLRAYKIKGEQAGLTFNVMTEETSANEKESKIVNAVGKKQVTLLTKIFGRGTDFVCLDKSVLDLGGVHVIQTFLSEDVSEEIQIQGRCARMGEKGSYSLVILDESLYMYYGERASSDRAIAEMRAARTTYTSISQKRREHFESQLPKKTVNVVQNLRQAHKASTDFVLDLLGSGREEPGLGTREERIRAFLSGTNAWVGNITRAAVRTVVMMDATLSMGGVIGGCKNTIERMITRACGIINKVRAEKGLTDADAPSFQVQFVVYRNYDAPATAGNESPNPILEVSKWDSRYEVLAQFLRPIEADHGWGNEAAELGFQHVNKELEKEREDIRNGLDPPKIKQVILVGDMPPNTPQEVESKRGQRTEEYWRRHFGEPTDYETELAKMVMTPETGTEGEKLKLPVHCFYVKGQNGHQAAQTTFQRIANSTGGQTGELDIKSEQGEEMLCGIVTTRILAVMEDGEAMVKAYSDQFGFRQPGHA